MRVLFALVLMVSGSAHAALTISNVQASRLRVAEGESVDIRFRLEESARVTLNLYDGRDLLIRRVLSAGALQAGDQVIVWDGRDESGKVVPPEAYTFTLNASSGKSTVTWDVADVTGGATLSARDVVWDSKTQKIRYMLDAPARVNIRAGFQDNGPLLRTVIDWVPRPAGLNEEPWDGWDASRVLALGAHPKLYVAASAFRLPDNTILVGASQSQVQLIGAPSWEKSERTPASQGPKRMYAHGQQPLEARGDFGVQLVLPASLRRNADGVPIVTGPIPVRLEIPDQDRARALARRFEPVFFLDGQFAFENEVGFVPMTWNWDPKAVNPGEHYLTVNLRGYEGNFGMATVKVIVEQERRP